MKETVSLEKMGFDTLQEAKDYRARLQRDFQQGCIEVRLLAELFPVSEDDDDLEEDFDSDEMEEEE